MFECGECLLTVIVLTASGNLPYCILKNNFCNEPALSV